MKVPSSRDVAEFYNGFNRQLLSDYVNGNERVSVQKDFFKSLISNQVSKILVIGCGVGDVAAELSKFSKSYCQVLGVDISKNNIAFARDVFKRKNLSFECRDIIKNPPSGKWDLILLPDVYEHIPIDSRQRLHKSLGTLLSETGSIALTCPTAEHQARLRENGAGLQIVDEDVLPIDILTLATDVEGILVDYRLIEVWGKKSYFHAVVDRLGGSRVTAKPPRTQSYFCNKIQSLIRLVKVKRRIRFLKSRGVDLWQGKS